MQERIDVKKDAKCMGKKIQREMFWWKLKKCPIIGQLVSFPKDSCENGESNSEDIKLYYLSLELVSSIVTKNKSEQKELKNEILNNPLMKEERSKEYKDYLLSSDFSDKDSVDKILDYAQMIFMLD